MLGGAERWQQPPRLPYTCGGLVPLPRGMWRWCQGLLVGLRPSAGWTGVPEVTLLCVSGPCSTRRPSTLSCTAWESPSPAM